MTEQMGMVERVAQALAKARIGAVGGPSWVTDIDWHNARAAIEAMREPTQAMEEAADAVCNERDLVDGSHIVLTGYRAMIDAALAEDATR